MRKHTDRVMIEEVDWLAIFPWLSLLRSFRMAVHPSKWLASLLIVVLVFLAGLLLDLFFGATVHNGEFDQYRQVHHGLLPRDQFDEWRDQQPKQSLDRLKQLIESVPKLREQAAVIAESPRPFDDAADVIDAHFKRAYQHAQTDEGTLPYAKDIDWPAKYREIRVQRRQMLATVESLRPRGAFAAVRRQASETIDRLARAAVTLNFGWSQAAGAKAPRGEVMPGEDAAGLGETGDALAYHDQTSVIAALRDLLLVLPAWLITTRPWFALLLLAASLEIVAVLGGAVARMAALDVTRDERIAVRTAIGYALNRWWSFLITPLAPLGIIIMVALPVVLGGAALFNPPEWGIDILGAAGFIVALVCGFIIVATALLTALGIHLVYPAIAIDGADLFDAVARAFSYVLNRFARWLFYSLVALIHGAATYLIIALVLWLTMRAAQVGAGWWVVTETGLGDNRFDVMFPANDFGQPPAPVDHASLDWSGRIAAMILTTWRWLVVALGCAYLISYYLTANTWIYVLLRRSADGVEAEDAFVPPPDTGQAEAAAKAMESPERTGPAAAPTSTAG